MKNKVNNSLVIMQSTLNRLPLYYSYIMKLEDEGVKNVSATDIAKNLNLNPVLVRKDLASVSSVSGKPRLGFNVGILLKDMKEYLGYNNKDEAVLVGVGSLGRLLLANKGFARLGLDIVAGFDKDERLYSEQINGKYIFPLEKLSSIVKRMNIKIGIIAVPEDQAQQVCDLMVESGILAIWNFPFTLLNVPEGILVKNENLASSLASLSHQLSKKQNSKSKKK
ncbi:MAG: redox-sensing transcriptional repressor Rex [Candidatus Limimorpha sp.]